MSKKTLRLPFSLLYLVALITLNIAPSTPTSYAGTTTRDQTPHSKPQTITSGNWTNLYPVLTSVSAVSDTEAWAGGDYGHIAHLVNGTWVDEGSPVLKPYRIMDMSMISSTSGWVTVGKKAFQYDGANWVEHSEGLSGFYLEKISAVSADDVWGVGYTLPALVEKPVHWNGSIWVDTGINLCSPCSSDIAMLSATEGWAVAENRFLHYVNGDWITLNPPSSSPQFFRVAALPDSVWAVAYDGSIYRYSNFTWTNWNLPGSGAATDIFMASPTRGWIATTRGIVGWDGNNWTVEYEGDNFGGVAAAGNQAWAVGGGDTLMHHVANASWEKLRGGPTSQAYTAVSAVSSDEAWTTANAALVSSGSQKILQHYHNGVWQDYPTSFSTGALNDIQMLSASEGYAVGECMIAKWDGVDWSQMSLPSSCVTFYGVSMISSQEGWAVGYDSMIGGGAIFHYANSAWTAQSNPAPRALNAVYMDSPTHGWAGGGSILQTVLLEYVNGVWVDRSSTLPSNEFRVRDLYFLSGGNEGWAVGDVPSDVPAYILHYFNGTWTIESTEPAGRGFSSVMPEASSELWAVGCDSAHRVGGVWYDMALPTTWCQNGGSLLPGQGGWAVGPEGTILHYDPLAPGQIFTDVPPDSPFYGYIQCLVSRGIISGYGDGTFRPGNNITRGQLSKVVSNAAGFNDPPGEQIFEDVAPDSAFYDWVQRLASRGFIGGYPCSGVGEPCGSGNRPYFRPGNETTRAQITKIVSNAAGFNDPPGEQLFEDMPPTHGFYQWVQRLALHGVMGGYPCGGVGEPCGPNNLPYFRPDNNATRGQVSKIVANTFLTDCNPSAKK